MEFYRNKYKKDEKKTKIKEMWMIIWDGQRKEKKLKKIKWQQAIIKKTENF